MNEFNGDVLGIGGVWAAPECEQSSAALEALPHLTAGQGEISRLSGEEASNNLIAQHEALCNLRREGAGGLHDKPLTDTRQRIADQHIYDAAAAVACVYE